jgi:hypothetical protein
MLNRLLCPPSGTVVASYSCNFRKSSPTPPCPTDSGRSKVDWLIRQWSNRPSMVPLVFPFFPPLKGRAYERVVVNAPLVCPGPFLDFVVLVQKCRGSHLLDGELVRWRLWVTHEPCKIGNGVRGTVRRERHVAVRFKYIPLFG